MDDENYFVLLDKYTRWSFVHTMGKDTTVLAVVTAIAQTFTSLAFLKHSRVTMASSLWLREKGRHRQSGTSKQINIGFTSLAHKRTG